MKLSLSTCLTSLLALFLFATGQTVHAAKIKLPRTFSQRGLASYYWEPQRTASGERFNPREMTAAHKTLPLGTVVEVRNTRNGNTVEVRINDRGPYVGGRIIDLSQAAAERLAFGRSGVVPVEIHIVD